MGTFLPSLHDKTWRDVTRALSQRGAVVLNAACNGTSAADDRAGTTAGYGVDLEQWRYFDDHGDAILVGACHSWDGKPHQYSNYNYRYRMLNAWGDKLPMGARPNVLGALVLLDQILQAGRFHLPDDGFCGDDCAPQGQTRN
jgi:hypothetical protein